MQSGIAILSEKTYHADSHPSLGMLLGIVAGIFFPWKIRPRLPAHDMGELA